LAFGQHLPLFAEMPRPARTVYSQFLKPRYDAQRRRQI
jgi:hypothetical protein